MLALLVVRWSLLLLLASGCAIAAGGLCAPGGPLDERGQRHHRHRAEVAIDWGAVNVAIRL